MYVRYTICCSSPNVQCLAIGERQGQLMSWSRSARGLTVKPSLFGVFSMFKLARLLHVVVCLVYDNAQALKLLASSRYIDRLQSNLTYLCANFLIDLRRVKNIHFRKYFKFALIVKRHHSQPK